MKASLVTVVVLATAAALLWAFVVPRVLDRSIRARLAKAGFHDAQFTVGEIGLHHVDVLDVTLEKGLELGDVEIESGPFALWRGRHPDLVLHGPRITANTGTRKAPGGKLPFGRVHVDRGEWRTGNARIAVRGSIDLRGNEPELALEARAPRITLGSRQIEDVVASVRGRSSDLHICGTGRLADGHVETCFQLKRSRIEAGAVRATIGHETAGDMAIDKATLAARFSGDLSTRTFDVQGELHAGSVASSKGTLDDARLAFDVTAKADNGVHVRSKRELVVDAASATLAIGNRLELAAPRITARGTARVADSVELTAGAPSDKLQLVTALRGVPVDEVLATTTKNHVRGTGVLDGQLVFELADDELALVGGKLAARHPGRLRVDELAAKKAETGYAVHRRLARALSDFAYTRFDLAVARDPEIRLALTGRGRAVPQEVAIDINVRGLFARNERKR